MLYNVLLTFLMSSPFIIGSFFGGFGFHFEGAEHSHSRETPHGATLTVDLEVSLEELYNGNFIEVSILLSLLC